MDHRAGGSWLVQLLPPHDHNFNKRLVKTVKLYILDAGLAAWLLGIKDAATPAHHLHVAVGIGKANDRPEDLSSVREENSIPPVTDTPRCRIHRQ